MSTPTNIGELANPGISIIIWYQPVGIIDIISTATGP